MAMQNLTDLVYDTHQTTAELSPTENDFFNYVENFLSKKSYRFKWKNSFKDFLAYELLGIIIKA